MSATRAAAERVREFVRGGGTGDAGLDHDLMLLAGEVLAPSAAEARAWPAIIRDNVEKGRREWWDGYRWFGLGSSSEYEPVIEPEPDRYECECGRRLPCRHCDGEAGTS